MSQKHEIDVSRFSGVTGTFDLNQDKIVCIDKRKHDRVLLGLRGNMHVPFACIKLYDSGLAKDAMATQDDAVLLGKAIEHRFNDYAALVRQRDEAVPIIKGLLKHAILAGQSYEVVRYPHETPLGLACAAEQKELLDLRQCAENILAEIKQETSEPCPKPGCDGRVTPPDAIPEEATCPECGTVIHYDATE